MITSKENILVIFGSIFPKLRSVSGRFNVIIAGREFKKRVEDLGAQFVELESLVGAGSIYEASSLFEELSSMNFPDGSRITKGAVYEGFELWWIHSNMLFHYFCLPYTQYKNLLEYLQNFQSVSFYKPTYPSLFYSYLQAYNIKMEVLAEPGIKSPSPLPFGVLIQIIITLFSLPILMLMKNRVLVYTGDKFDKGKDYDFRMRFVYEELRARGISFTEFIRGIEPWKNVLGHAFKRARPVVYSDGVIFTARFLSVLAGPFTSTQRFRALSIDLEKEPEKRFKLLVVTHYLLESDTDIWAIKIMKWILRAIGVKAAFIPVASERSFHTVLACKLNEIPTVGILHGVSSRNYNIYDFMPGFDGEKTLSVDQYGLWSNWWREHFLKYSKAYNSEQLVVSGPMRPLENLQSSSLTETGETKSVRVLLVAEQTALPEEVMPYLQELLKENDFDLTIKFRPYRDGFENWLLENEPGILNMDKIKVVKGGMQEAIQGADVVIGCHSTGVLEALLQFKMPIFMHSRKWGDYYDLKDYDEKHSFFAEDPTDLKEKIKNASLVPMKTIQDLRERYFGDPHKNGSKWVVDRLEEILKI